MVYSLHKEILIDFSNINTMIPNELNDNIYLKVLITNFRV